MNESVVPTLSLLRRIGVFLDNLSYALGTRKPRLILKLIRSQLRARWRRFTPRSLMVAVDYRCNLTCDHCSARSLNDRAKPVMTNEDYRSLAEQADRLGIFNIQFTGGEPLLRKDLEEVISLFHPRKNFILISTNATLLDEARARRLKSAGVDALAVSLDSADETVHDAFRGKTGAWQKTIGAVKIARRAGLKVALGAVVTHQNVGSEDLERLAVLSRSLGCKMLLTWACPVGAWAGNREARLTDQDMQSLAAFQQRHTHVRTDFDGNYRERGCPAMKETMYVTAQGELLPCAFIPISYGSVKQETLGQLRDRALADPMYQPYWNHCLSACNETFYRDYLTPTFGRTAPLPHSKLSKVEASCT